MVRSAANLLQAMQSKSRTARKKTSSGNQFGLSCSVAAQRRPCQALCMPDLGAAVRYLLLRPSQSMR
jgi:hypothetical protein